MPKSIEKYITSMQLTHFGFLAHAIYLLFIPTDYRPRVTPVICLWQAMVFVSLFLSTSTGENTMLCFLRLCACWFHQLKSMHSACRGRVSSRMHVAYEAVLKRR